MEGSEIIEAQKVLGLPPPLSLTVGMAINGKTKSKHVVKWALEKFIQEEKVLFKLLHVCPKITSVPTPMGNSIPISQVREDVAAAYKKEKEWQANQMLLPYKNMCTQRKVQVDVIVIESDDVANAIAEEVAKCTIKKLVIGASSCGMFTRKLKGNDLSSRISTCTPNFCTVYAVSKGKLSSIRPSDLETNGSIRDDSSVTSSTNSSSSHTLSLQTDAVSIASYSQFHSPSLPMQRFQALSTINQGLLDTRTNSIETNHSRCQSLDVEVQAISTINQGLLHTRTNSIETNHSRCRSLDIEEGNYAVSSWPSTSENGHPTSQSSSCKSFPTDYQSWASDQASTSDMLTDYSSSESQAVINFELEKLRIELRHVRGIYAMAQSEAIDASRKLNDLSTRRLEEAIKLKEINFREEKAKELARQEKERSKAALREAEYTRTCAEREASRRQEAELKAMRDAKEKEKLQNALVGPVQQYQKFTWEEIVSATSSFSDDLKIGMGAYGTVYKCSLHHTTAAVKVLHSIENQNSKQFQQELEILSKIRHPHLLILLGACSDHGCLVYEYMENGSLEDRLLRVNNTPPIPWFERYRIAWEVASALVFLHNSKPKPIIHRDMKPANILLDHNLVSKIGDVGLSTVLNTDASFATTTYKDTGLVGTLCYIDPEYQRTGLVSPKSDVYAFGMVILQLLTAKPAKALTHIMETAIDDGRLLEILDSEAGNWPHEETKELALLGLRCAELRRRDRPDLKDQVLPALERLKEIADKARDTTSSIHPTPPSHFICPILKDIMIDPCVASDGYTYDRKAIEKWLEENDKSPMTNLPLPNKNLLPNYTLLSAIMEWKSNKQ
ncbi:U-box domain-containing protein 35 isoform X2 [Hevea brasiliensis]|uniref:U-box domain-containing protein 35 isoform X2 n=1 Tax=Hevea brasiliensis TaxID=3981 RepID=UPI0025F996E0|nr:U-box domain-containing protein 35 isoform X2 [Hevea brasiliensis]